MSKEKQHSDSIEEAGDDLFKGFKDSFLNQPVPKAVTKKEKVIDDVIEVVEDLDDDQLTPEETAELEKVAASVKKPIKKVVEDVIDKPLSDDVIDADENMNVFFEFAKQLSDNGVVELEDGDKVETDEDLEKIVTKTIKKGIDSYKSSKPEDVQKFLDFVDNGGNPSDFHKYYYGEGSFEDFDISTEENQKYVISESLKIEGYSEEEIIEELADIEDTGKLDKKSSIHLKKLQKIEWDNKQLLVEAQAAYAQSEEAKRTIEWENFRKGLFESEAIGGFKITPKAKNELWEYMTKPVNKKVGKTQYQIDNEENIDARYVFAYLLKNKWNMSSLESQVQTKEVSKLKAKLNRYSDSMAKKNPTRDSKRVETAEDNPFTRFKEMLA